MSCRSSVYATANSAMAHSHSRTFIVRRLDGAEQEVSVDKKSIGEELMDKVCKSIGLLEKDYFGLQYRDKNGDHLWLNLRNPLHEQVPHGPRSLVEMRVKFFVQPQKLMQVVTRFHFYRHLRKELILGRLRCPPTKATHFTALIAQIDKGDYHPSFEYRHKVPCDMVDNDTFLTRVRREHHLLMGTPSEIAVEKFLNEAAGLDHYGVEMYHTLSSKGGKHIIVGVGPECIYVYSGSHLEVQKRFSYGSVQYTAFHARKFTAVIENNSSQLEFEMKSRGAAQALYRAVTEFHTFFQRDVVGSMIKDAGFCKSLIGTFKGQTPDRFYFDVIRTHKQVVDNLWPMMHPNSPMARRPPAALPSTTSLASQRSTRSLPSGRHHRINRQVGSMPRSVSSDNHFHHHPPAFRLPPPTPVHRPNPGVVRHGSDRSAPPNSPFFYHTHLQPPPSPFNPYASNIEENSSDSDDQSAYVSGESDTYVCMRGSETLSIRRASDHSVEGSETYVNSTASDISSASMDGRIPSPPPVYSEIDPHRDRTTRSPDSNFALDPSALTMGAVINEEDALNFDASAVLARTRELESELQRLRTAMTCRLCQSNPIGATFCPCGHTVCCYGCATRLNNCLECHQPVSGVQKMLLA